IRFTFSTIITNLELVVIYNGKYFIIYLHANNFSKLPKLKELYLFFLKVTKEFKLDNITIKDF
ncbi:uncharacterized protein BKA55DRAFT_531410, partial [Fusarium redolens]